MDQSLAVAIHGARQGKRAFLALRRWTKGAGRVTQAPNFGGLTTWSPQKPVIAAVDGYALAGGFELAISCDLIVANVGAKFGIPEAKRGLVAAGGGVVRLPRLVSRAVAMEMALTGEALTATRAYELGLIHQIVAGPALDGARVLAQRKDGRGDKIRTCDPLLPKQ